MSRVSFSKGDEVVVVGRDGYAYRLAKVTSVDERGVYTSGNPRTGDAMVWSKTGLSRDSQHRDQRIVLSTDDRRREVRVREWRFALQRSGAWSDATPEQIEAVTRIMGLDAE